VDREEFNIYNGINLRDRDGQDLGEFDFAVVDQSGEIVEIYEVKAVTGKGSSASKQLSNGLEFIDNDRVQSLSGDLNTEQFKSNSDNIGETTVGPTNPTGEHDLQMPLSEDEFTELTEAITARQSN